MRVFAGTAALLLVVAPSVGQAEEKKATASPAPAVPAVAAAASDPGAVERISVAELKKLMDENKVLVVDVRSAESYKTSHIAGSVSAPLAEIANHVETLKSAKKPIVTYCS